MISLPNLAILGGALWRRSQTSTTGWLIDWLSAKMAKWFKTTDYAPARKAF